MLDIERERSVEGQLTRIVGDGVGMDGRRAIDGQRTTVVAQVAAGQRELAQFELAAVVGEATVGGEVKTRVGVI